MVNKNNSLWNKCRAQYFIMFHWWSEAHTLTPYQPHTLSEDSLWLICFPAPLSDYCHILYDNGIIFPSMLNLLHWKLNWLEFDCLWARRASIFQRWKLMLSFWQHCDSTNSLDGAFRPRSLWMICTFLFLHAKWTEPVFLCNWVHYWEGCAFTDPKLLWHIVIIQFERILINLMWAL